MIEVGEEESQEQSTDEREKTQIEETLEISMHAIEGTLCCTMKVEGMVDNRRLQLLIDPGNTTIS